jgi:outer membrane protein OmpA-like peptidoglycan-associated protein
MTEIGVGLTTGEKKMSGNFGKLRLGVACAVAAAFVALSGTGPVQAGDVSSQQILNALKPKAPALTRSLSGAGAAGPAVDAKYIEDQKFLDGLRTKRTRSLSSGDRDRVAAIAKEKPQIDLEINFDYNSDKISKKAQPAVEALGKALSDPELRDSVFLVAGHTDAKGGDAYNQGLSERRAEAIKTYLIQKYSLQAENLMTVGYGKEQLKNKENPLAADNRRVQVVNMAAQSQASR